MSPVEAAVAAGLSAALVGFAVSGLVVRLGPVDAPDQGLGARASHRRPTPTSGGLAIVAASSVGAWIYVAVAGRPASYPPTAVPQIAAALALAAVLGLLGAMDDLFDLGARNKLAAQAVLAVLFALLAVHVEALPITGAVSLSLGLVAGVLGTALWIVVTTNAMNFMDGANGVAPGGAVIAFAALSAAAFASDDAATGGAALAAAAAGLGLLPWNVGGKLFQGDAGSTFSGFYFAALAVIASRRPGVYLYFGPVALLPFITDVLLTLLVRARGRRPLLQAHREHLYQLWLAEGRSHLALAVRVWAVAAAFALAALAGLAAPDLARLALFAGALVVSCGGWILMRRRLNAGASARPQQYPPP